MRTKFVSPHPVDDGSTFSRPEPDRPDWILSSSLRSLWAAHHFPPSVQTRMYLSKSVIVATLSLVGAFALVGFAVQQQTPSASADPTVDVGVVVNDLEASLQFYREVLGMEQRRTIDISEDFGRRSGLTGGAPTEIRVLTLGDGEAATEWKLMTFEDEAAEADESDVTDQQGMQYITLQVDQLGPYLERARAHGVEPRGETPVALGEENHFLLLQAPEGTFVELIGPLKQ